ncbi:insulinase family protein, partial [Candidatus Peregrinibacteria bacterium]|nr:insulinase family protein [Candidatus Peregrinibacteria bacterium]
HLLYPETLGIKEYLSKFDAVRKEQVDALARRILTPDQFRLAIIGPEKDEDALHKLLA